MGWSIFVACMFLGLGIGMLFDHAGSGIIIGMGVGFLLEGIVSGRGRVKSKTREVIYSLPHSHRVIGSVVLVVIGIGFGFVITLKYF